VQSLMFIGIHTLRQDTRRQSAGRLGFRFQTWQPDGQPLRTTPANETNPPTVKFATAIWAVDWAIVAAVRHRNPPTVRGTLVKCDSPSTLPPSHPPSRPASLVTCAFPVAMTTLRIWL